MDPRRQYPYSRDTTSSYGRNPLHPSSTQSSYPPSSHPQNSPTYTEHQRRPSDPSYYQQPQRSYGSEAGGQGHSRHQSASSIGHVSNRMPPPSSPQERSLQHSPRHESQSYGPPPPRAPPVSVGPPTAFPSGRELPSLPGIRPPNNSGSSMSISSMLGGPPATREQPPTQYASPVSTTAQANVLFPGPNHASPRTNTASSDYTPFRRPQTPEHQRQYGSRDNRVNSAGSPHGAHFASPETHQYNTPQQYRERTAQGQVVSIADDRRDAGPIRVPNTSIPPRPNSQPAFNGPQSRLTDTSRGPIHSDSFGRRVESTGRPPERSGRNDGPYQRPSTFPERQDLEPAFAYAERERLERETIQREREERERMDRSASVHQEYPHQMTQRNPQNSYNRPPEPREQPAWMRSGYEHQRPNTASERRIQEQASRMNGHEYSTPNRQYSGPPTYSSNDSRHPPSLQPSSMPSQHVSPPTSHLESSIQERERQRLAQLQQQQQSQQLQQSLYSTSRPNGQYQPQESPTRRTAEDSQQMQQRGFLGVQEINRKGRASPLPQAVQGAQPQPGVPGGEPGIKSEFGRMFSGIGSGVGSSLSISSPSTASAQGLPFSTSSQLRRDDLDGLVSQDSPTERNGGHGLARTSSRGGGVRRRKLKEEDGKGDDESSNGRLTPSSRAKRTKLHHHHQGHHHHHHHHHHHRPEGPEDGLSPLQGAIQSLKNVKASPGSPPHPDTATPILHHHHIPRHHHHVITPVKPTEPVNQVIPLPKTTIRSQAVLDSVKHLSRHHLGHGYYQALLKPRGIPSPGRSLHESRGFASTSLPLPRFEGQENCTFTIKVPHIYLSATSREEITARRGVWGTDIYTDDSDIVAACIHQGWFRGEWPEDVDVSLLGLELDDGSSDNNTTKSPPKTEGEVMLTSPPAKGPMPVPPLLDLHVTVLILPALEKYSSTTRFGMRSREWGGKHDGWTSTHDGLSFMIMSIKWVNGVDSNVSRSGLSRRMELEDAELKAEEVWRDLIVNGNGKVNGYSNGFKESFVRGESVPELEAVLDPNGNIKSLGMKSWWKKEKKGKTQEEAKTTTDATMNNSADVSENADHIMDESAKEPVTNNVPVSVA
ncbi:histone deacetylation protein Rxt3-domain-containing protein [Xylogone sp. PMI_703]|nr:histone deacetylation protein Rxt3-domain-containing protein [Xylogone sp. PMI_703]